MVNPVGPSRVQEEGVQTDLARLEMAEELRHGNVYEIMKRLPAGLTIRDFEDYMSNQWRTFRSQIVQDGPVYVGDASVPEPQYSDFPMHSGGTALSSDEGNEFVKGMAVGPGKGSGFKAVGIKAAEGGEGEAASGYSDLEGMAEGTLDEWESFTSEMWNQIFDAQLAEDYQKKMGEIQKDVDRIIALAKSGQADPEYVLIALAKVNLTKNGCLMTWLGKKTFMNNAMMNRVANDLSATPTSDPNYYAAVQGAQSKTRDGQFQMQIMLSDMQKVMQDVTGVLGQVKDMIDGINRTRREIITAVAAR